MCALTKEKCNHLKKSSVSVYTSIVEIVVFVASAMLYYYDVWDERESRVNEKPKKANITCTHNRVLTDVTVERWEEQLYV